jgi:hypothetical protein
MKTLSELTIPVGWTVFFDSVDKKATGYSQFKKAAKAKTAFSVLSASTEAELLDLCKAQGIKLPEKK